MIEDGAVFQGLDTAGLYAVSRVQTYHALRKDSEGHEVEIEVTVGEWADPPHPDLRFWAQAKDRLGREALDGRGATASMAVMTLHWMDLDKPLPAEV